MTGNKEFSSGGTGVLGEENNEECASNKEWNQEDGGNKDVPPIVGFVKNAVEDLSEKSYEKHNGDNTNSNNTTFHRETTAAREVFGFLGRTMADAAAAEALIDFISIKLLFFWILFLNGFFHLFHIITHFIHEWLLIIHTLDFVGH